jgi:hypothetical protein
MPESRFSHQLELNSGAAYSQRVANFQWSIIGEGTFRRDLFPIGEKLTTDNCQLPSMIPVNHHMRELDKPAFSRGVG